MFGQALASNTSESNESLQRLKNLLKEKYLKVDVVKVCSADDEVRVTLLNGLYGIHHDIDEENKRPIAYLQAFDGKVSQEKTNYSYWSHSVIAFPKARLDEVIEGLTKMPTLESTNNVGKTYCRC